MFASIGANVLWFAHSGMEASLFIALSLTAIAAATNASGKRASALLAGSAAGLLALLRPDGMALGLLLVTCALLRLRRDGSRRILWMAVPFVAAVTIYAGINFANTGRSCQRRSPGADGSGSNQSRALSATERVVDFVDAWAHRLRTYSLGVPDAGLFAVLGVALHGASRLWRLRNEAARLLLVWVGAHFALYAVVLPTPGHGGRYQPLVPFLFGGLVVLGSVSLLEALFRRRSRDARWVETLAVVGVGLPLLAMIRPLTRLRRGSPSCGCPHQHDGDRRGSSRLPDAESIVVASFDIGGVGFASHRPILDLGGLSDPGLIPSWNAARSPSTFVFTRSRYWSFPRQAAPDSKTSRCASDSATTQRCVSTGSSSSRLRSRGGLPRSRRPTTALRARSSCTASSTRASRRSRRPLRPTPPRGQSAIAPGSAARAALRRARDRRVCRAPQAPIDRCPLRTARRWTRAAGPGPPSQR